MTLNGHKKIWQAQKALSYHPGPVTPPSADGAFLASSNDFARMRCRLVAVSFYRNSRCSRWPWRGLRCRRRSRSWRCLRAQEWKAQGRATGPRRPWCSSESLVISYVKKSRINLRQCQMALRHLRTKVEIPIDKEWSATEWLKKSAWEFFWR